MGHTTQNTMFFGIIQNSFKQLDCINVHKVTQTQSVINLNIQFTWTEMINLPTQNSHFEKKKNSPSHNTINNITTCTLPLTVSVTL